jgi:hypothetical protein
MDIGILLLGVLVAFIALTWPEQKRFWSDWYGRTSPKVRIAQVLALLLAILLIRTYPSILDWFRELR